MVFHIKCTPVAKVTSVIWASWIYKDCATLFPFYILDDDDLSSYLLDSYDSKHIDIENMLFNPFDLNRKKETCHD